MNGLDFTDKTGELPTLEEVRRARACAGKMLVTSMLKLPPELAVELTTIHRCLGVLEAFIITAMKKTDDRETDRKAV